MYTCPKNSSHTTFQTAALIREERVIDRHGNMLERHPFATTVESVDTSYVVCTRCAAPARVK